MTNPPHDRREGDQHMQVLANKIENLSDNIVKLEIGFAEVTKAIVKFSLVEERQTQIFISLDRTTLLIDRWILRQEAHEKACVQQEKELRALVFDTAKDLSQRIDALEKAEPMQEQAGKWVMGAVWGAAALLAAVVAKQLGLM